MKLSEENSFCLLHSEMSMETESDFRVSKAFYIAAAERKMEKLNERELFCCSFHTFMHEI